MINGHVFSDQEWNEIGSMVEIVKMAYLTTKRMQKIPFTLSDLYATWNELKLSLLDMEKHSIAKHMLEALKTKEVGIIDYPATLACTYMDPRLKCLLTTDEKAVAVQHLLSIRQRLKKQGKDEHAALPRITKSLPVPKLGQAIASRRAAETMGGDTDFLLPLLGMSTQTDLNESSIDYWRKLKKELPDLFAVSAVLNAASPTQMIVEGAFSSLSYILNRYRQNLGQETLQNILLIRLNKHLFNSISLKP